MSIPIDTTTTEAMTEVMTVKTVKTEMTVKTVKTEKTGTRMKVGLKQHKWNRKVWRKVLGVDCYMNIFTDCIIDYEKYSNRRIKKLLHTFSNTILWVIKKEVKRSMKLEGRLDYKAEIYRAMNTVFPVLVKRLANMLDEVFIGLMHMKFYAGMYGKYLTYFPEEDMGMLPQNALGKDREYFTELSSEAFGEISNLMYMLSIQLPLPHAMW